MRKAFIIALAALFAASLVSTADAKKRKRLRAKPVAAQSDPNAATGKFLGAAANTVVAPVQSMTTPTTKGKKGKK